MSHQQHSEESHVVLRDHVFDGIQEYDQRLPNWWKMTFYGAIVFASIYWFYFFQGRVGLTDAERMIQAMNRIEEAKLAQSVGNLTDETLWKFSRNAEVVAAGKVTFMSTCASCHGTDLKGGIGVNLVDNTWIHGGNPTQVYATVQKGVLEKGMPTWGPVLGDKRIVETVSFVLSHHQPPAP